MNSPAVKIIILLAVFLCFFLLQSGGISVFWGVGVNLLLLFSVRIGLMELRLPVFFILLGFELVLAWWWTPFWIIPFMVFPAISVAVLLFRGKLTGNRFLDFIVAVAVATVAASFILSPSPLSVFKTPVLVYELLLNLAVGIVLWSVSGPYLAYHAKTTHSL